MSKQFSSKLFPNYQEDLLNLEQEEREINLTDNNKILDTGESSIICNNGSAKYISRTNPRNLNLPTPVNFFQIYEEIDKDRDSSFFKSIVRGDSAKIDNKASNEDVSENANDEQRRVQYPPIFKSNDLDRANNYNEKLMQMLDTIRQFEENIKEKMNLLEDEKLERLQIQEEMCSEISSDQPSDKNALLFLNLCKSERIFREEKNDSKSKLANDRSTDQRPKTTEPGKKDFIHRNIEVSNQCSVKLATKAMSKLPLTDEEKRQLDQILSDIDADGNEQNVENLKSQEGVVDDVDTDDTVALTENAFHLSEEDRQRICNIDLELENNFSETKNLRSTSYDEDNFWKSLIVEQTLKQIDEKLAILKKADEAVDEKLQDDESTLLTKEDEYIEEIHDGDE